MQMWANIFTEPGTVKGTKWVINPNRVDFATTIKRHQHSWGDNLLIGKKRVARSKL